MNNNLKKLFFFLLFICSFSIHSAEKVTDIKIEGLQRVDPGLIYNSIPFDINDDIDSIDFSKTINLIYKTGQFKDVVIEKEGSIIIIALREKPILYELNFFGTESFQPENLTAALNSMNIASGLIVDDSDLLRAQKEIASNFLSFGKYSATVEYELVPLSNNRVNVNFYINEGSVSRIKEINIVGNKNYKTKDLLSILSLKTTNYLSWWNKDDRYSRQTLTGDLEKIKSFYMDRGYLDFKITSSVVSISKNKKNVFINLGIDEGKRYKIGKVSLTGSFLENINKDELLSKIEIKKNDVFNRGAVNNSVKNLSKLMGNYGYAFANINAIPDVNFDNRIVGFNFHIDEGKKIYVRRINIIGNDSSKDEVIRRELRQYEASWFSQEKIDISKQRLTRTQFFESVTIETPTIPGTSDQVDVNVIVEETNTGKFNIGAGVSSSEGIVGTLGLSQSNFLGTGNRVSTSLSLGGINKVYSLSFTDPYWTADGVSRGFSSYYRDFDSDELNTGDYKSTDMGFGMNFGIPLDEFKQFSVGSNIDFREIKLQSTSPQKYKDYCSQISSPGATSCDANSLLVFLNWSDNTFDNPFFTTKGHKLSLSFDATLPGLDLEYYKVMARAEKYFPISESVVTKIKSAVGYADNYGDDPYPFFENFRVGGKSSVRGYKEGSIGKKTYDANANGFVTYGGKKMVYFGAETFFPVPFMEKSDKYRLSVFVDGGGAFEDSFSGDQLRYSAGLGILWVSPFGPLNASIALPLNDGSNDQTEKFQFGMGSSF